MAEQKLLSDEERAAFMAENQHRHPVLHRVKMPNGDVLRMILGNPSATCPAIRPENADPCWNEFVGAILGVKEQSRTLGTQLAKDVVLWPENGVVSKWIDRWPQLPKTIGNDMQTKIGVGSPITILPVAPTALLEPLQAARHGECRTVILGGAQLSFVLSTPNALQWSTFKEQVNEKNADAWKVLVSLVKASVRALCDANGNPVDLATTLASSPGFALASYYQIFGLVGGTAESELGEW